MLFIFFKHRSISGRMDTSGTSQRHSVYWISGGVWESVVAFDVQLQVNRLYLSLPRPSLYKNKRAIHGETYEPTTYEHWANALSHAIGIVPSVIVFRHMVAISHREIQSYVVIIYGMFTTLLFWFSTCYHICELMYRQKRIRTKLRYYLHICDRAAIYLFIAASYTPWLVLRHCGYLGLNLKWLIWVFALLGILYQYNFHERYKTLETLIYILVAGCPSVAIFTMNNRSGLEWMIVGGLVYITGVVFFKMDGIVPFAHAIWHVFVLVGASCHIYAVYSSLLGPDPNSTLMDISDIKLQSRIEL